MSQGHRTLAVLLAAATLSLGAAGLAEAGHRHSRGCNHRHGNGRYYDQGRGGYSHGYGYKYAPRPGYYGSGGYGYGGYGYGYAPGYRHRCVHSCRHRPYYGHGYGGYAPYPYGYGYPPPRYAPRAGVTLHLNF
ncbi:MAG TPA: hypothetical protein VI589_00800 [Vicinamibacteria bacterium]